MLVRGTRHSVTVQAYCCSYSDSLWKWSGIQPYRASARSFFSLSLNHGQAGAAAGAGNGLHAVYLAPVRVLAPTAVIAGLGVCLTLWQEVPASPASLKPHQKLAAWRE